MGSYRLRRCGISENQQQDWCLWRAVSHRRRLQVFLWPFGRSWCHRLQWTRCSWTAGLSIFGPCSCISRNRPGSLPRRPRWNRWTWPLFEADAHFSCWSPKCRFAMPSWSWLLNAETPSPCCRPLAALRSLWARTIDPLRLLYAVSPEFCMIYIQGFPVIFGRIIDLDGLGAFLIGGVASEHVDFVFEDEWESGGARCAHGREVSPFFWLFRQESTLFDAVLLAGGQQLVLFVPSPEDEDVAQSARLEEGAHVRVSLLFHAW